MKERPILFSAPMVRALLAGTKTQTRRIMKPQPSEGWRPHAYDDVHRMHDGLFVERNGGPVIMGWGPSNDDGSEAYPCPYGQSGDRLWVRETWGICPDYAETRYRADRGMDDRAVICWRPSIHMFRSKSRITLEITGVRVERLGDISEEDAKAEGVEIHPPHDHRDHRMAFGQLWDAINGPGATYLNPWVWVVEFRRI